MGPQRAQYMAMMIQELDILDLFHHSFQLRMKSTHLLIVDLLTATRTGLLIMKDELRVTGPYKLGYSRD